MLEGLMFLTAKRGLKKSTKLFSGGYHIRRNFNNPLARHYKKYR